MRIVDERALFPGVRGCKSPTSDAPRPERRVRRASCLDTHSVRRLISASRNLWRGRLFRNPARERSGVNRSEAGPVRFWEQSARKGVRRDFEAAVRTNAGETPALPAPNTGA